MKRLSILASILLLVLTVFGCTNINDPQTLKEQYYTVNEMKISAVKIVVDSADLAGKTVALYAKDGTKVGVDGVIGGDYKKNAGLIEFAEPIIIEGNNEGKWSGYLKIDTSKYIEKDFELEVSPYGTADKDLPVRILSVELDADNIDDASYSWVMPVDFSKNDILKFKEPAYVIGDFAGNFAALSGSGYTRSYTFTYNNSMTAWGGGNGKINFALTTQGDWNGLKYSGATISVGGDAALTKIGDDNNIVCEGLEDGGSYTITTSGDEDGVKVQIKKN